MANTIRQDAPMHRPEQCWLADLVGVVLTHTVPYTMPRLVPHPVPQIAQERASRHMPHRTSFAPCQTPRSYIVRSGRPSGMVNLWSAVRPWAATRNVYTPAGRLQKE